MKVSLGKEKLGRNSHRAGAAIVQCAASLVPACPHFLGMVPPGERGIVLLCGQTLPWLKEAIPSYPVSLLVCGTSWNFQCQELELARPIAAQQVSWLPSR
jgi:hypothetical protein